MAPVTQIADIRSDGRMKRRAYEATGASAAALRPMVHARAKMWVSERSRRLGRRACVPAASRLWRIPSDVRLGLGLVVDDEIIGTEDRGRLERLDVGDGEDLAA